MRTFFTTEENLTKILHSRDSNVWKQLLSYQDAVFVNSPSGQWDRNNKTLLAYHRSGRQIYSYNEFFEVINHDPRRVLGLCQPTLLLDAKSTKTEAMMNEYGVCCYPVESKEKPYYTAKGRKIESDDPDIINKSWAFLYDGLNKCSNSLVIIDRYFFASQWNKDSGCPDDDLNDSYDNLEAILDQILPSNASPHSINVLIVFDCSTVTNSGRNRFSPPTFQDIVNQVEVIKTTINRPYDYDIEIISVQSGCAFYNETHDRFVITNYSITEASHKLKAFNRNGDAIDNQTISFDYSYSAGIAPNDRSSVPARTQERVIKAIKSLLTRSGNFPMIKYALNGVIVQYGVGVLKNRLLTGV